jgi:hypothetical protein
MRLKRLRFVPSLYSGVAVMLLFAGPVTAGTTGLSSRGASRLALPTVRQTAVAFTENRGQWPDSILFRADASGTVLWFRRTGISFEMDDADNDRDDTPDLAWFGSQLPRGPSTAKTRLRPVRMVDLEFVGANHDTRIRPRSLLPHASNFFLGDDPARWRTHVPSYSSITLQNLYPGIDVDFFADEFGRVRYAFQAAPGKDLAQVRADYSGALEPASGLSIEPIDAARQSTGMLSPVGRTPDARSFVSGPDAASAANVTLAYSTYLGGAASDSGIQVAVDASGNAYVTGITLSADFPTVNSYDGTISAGNDAFVSKLSAAGSGLIYSTYIGGNNEDVSFDIDVDSSGHAYITGSTYSTDFPTKNAYQSNQPDQDVFVTKLGIDGDSLIFSTYLGGSLADGGNELAVDGSGNVFVTGYAGSSDFPTASAFQGTYQGGYDAFVTKLASTGSSLIYSTFLGGSGLDNGSHLLIDASGNAYVCGYTGSTNFPTQNPYQTDQGVEDAFLTKLASTGSSLIYSTYLGGSGVDVAICMGLDASGSAYVTGFTQSTNFPTVNAYQTDQPGQDGFVTKFSSAGNTLVYSTYLGGSLDDAGYAVVVDATGHAYVTGYTTSTNFPTLYPYQTDQTGTDIFITQLMPAGSSLLYSTYLGGNAQDIGTFIALDDSENVYITGNTGSTNFPTLNPYQTNQAGSDAFVTKLNAFLDSDGDGVPDPLDICPGGDDALDADGDGVPDFCDICPGFDDAVDADGDGVPDGCDNCPADPNPGQEDSDSNGIGDVCDEPACPIDLTGDVNISNTITSADIIALVNFVFKGGANPLPCDAAGDANCSGSVTSADIIALVNFVFKSGAPPCDACTLVPGTWSCP